MKININTALKLIEVMSKESLLLCADGTIGYAIMRNIDRLNKQEKVVAALKMRETLMTKHAIQSGSTKTTDENFVAFVKEFEPILQDEFEIELIQVEYFELDELFAKGIRGITAMDINILETFLGKGSATE